jgi:hypothetical protein
VRPWSALFAVLLIAVAPQVASAHPSVSVVMDSRGNVFYSDLNRVWRLTPDGQKSIVVPNVHTHELFIDRQDNLYGEHLWYTATTKKWGHRVWKREPNGDITDVVPATEGFREDYSFVRDTAGTMYFAPNKAPLQIMKRTASGTTTVLSRGPFSDIREMVAGNDGALYVIDSVHLKKVLPDGRIVRLAPFIATRSISRLNVGARHAVMGLWMDGRANVYAANYGSGSVKRVSPTGDVSVIDNSAFPWSPTGGMVAPSGDLYILEVSVVNEVRLKRIGRDGSVRYF